MTYPNGQQSPTMPPAELPDATLAELTRHVRRSEWQVNKHQAIRAAIVRMTEAELRRQRMQRLLRRAALAIAGLVLILIAAALVCWLARHLS